jgi:hypothetical protein
LELGAGDGDGRCRALGAPAWFGRRRRSAATDGVGCSEDRSHTTETFTSISVFEAHATPSETVPDTCREVPGTGWHVPGTHERCGRTACKALSHRDFRTSEDALTQVPGTCREVPGTGWHVPGTVSPSLKAAVPAAVQAYC